MIAWGGAIKSCFFVVTPQTPRARFTAGLYATQGLASTKDAAAAFLRGL
jgi:hypothetical protein